MYSCPVQRELGVTRAHRECSWSDLLWVHSDVVDS